MTAAPRPFDESAPFSCKCPGRTRPRLAAARAREAQLTKPAGSLGRLEEIADVPRRLAGVRAAACRQPAGRRVRRQSRRRRARRVAVPAVGHERDGRELHRRRRGDQPDLQDLRHFAQSLRARPRAADRRHHQRAGDGRAHLRRRPSPTAWRRSPPSPTCSCLGEMGIGNTTAAAAIYHALYGGEAEDWVGRGTGVDDEGLKRKADAVRAAVALHKAHLDDPLEVLARLGGREIAAMAGAILAARLAKSPGRARRLRRLLRGRAYSTRSTRPRSIIASPATSRPSAPSAGAEPARQGADSRSRHAARRRFRRRARGRRDQGGRRLPQRHGDLRRGRGRGEGLGTAGRAARL